MVFDKQTVGAGSEDPRAAFQKLPARGINKKIMENKNTSNRELENLLRNGLEQVNESPDNDLWDKIEARQQPQNLGLRIRHIARYMMPMAAAVAASINKSSSASVSFKVS